MLESLGKIVGSSAEAERFVREIFGRRPAVFSGPTAGFADLFDWAEMERMLQYSQVHHPRVRVTKNGAAADEGAIAVERVSHEGVGYTRLLSGAVMAELSDGATLVVDSADELSPPLRRLAADLERELQEHVEINVYCSWGTEPGLGLHWDDHEVIVLQVAGEKKWEIHSPTLEAPTAEQQPPPPAAGTEPAMALTLRAGESLHVPRGWWHLVASVGVPSLHLTIGIRPATGVDLLAAVVREVGARAAMRVNIPRWGSPAETAQYLATVREAVQEELSGSDLLQRFLLMRNGRDPGRGALSLASLGGDGRLHLDDDSIVRLVAPRARIEFDGEQIKLYGAGHELSIRTEARAVLEILFTEESISFRELSAKCSATMPGNAIEELLSDLTILGLISLERGRITSH
ncbi:cupin domain-containing protein [Actinoplanes sichuanensis]|uniref:Cupin domain-containing protein n=1 Tax=Actinoplanes sichuanensis TaxID=512349 RepID=A0ABW4AR26_9ACTN|nr:cupin domain-containing protein [Actinoplanes sichuanensis]BEL07470.1 cupin domain-containing protein [Actinoplanes sichuanensis]